MGDIAGCRCILDSDDEVYRLMRALKSHQILIIDDNNGVNNYIKHPQESGYKSIHMYATIKGYGKRKVEIQLRSKKHHDWATFVEVLDTVYKINIKERLIGKDQVVYDDFSLFHKILSKKDKHLTTDDVKYILYHIAKYDILQAVSRLMVQNIATVRRQWADILSNCSYIPRNFYISISGDGIPDIKAFESYTDSEKHYYLQFAQDNTANQVLVCMNSPSFDSISTAYSNYILVCHEFTHRLHHIMAKAIENQSFNPAFLLNFVMYYRTRIAKLTRYVQIEREGLSKAKYDDDIMSEWQSDVQSYLKRFDEDMTMLSIATNKFYVNKTKGFKKIVAWIYYIWSRIRKAM
jgi:hypothetical protein